MMDNVEVKIHFSGTPEQAERLIEHTKDWDLFEVSSGITIEFIPVDEEHDPYVGAHEILEYADSEQYTSGLGAKTVIAIRRHASSRRPKMQDGSPPVIERDGLPYIHEDLLRLASVKIDDFDKIGEKSALFLTGFFEHRNKVQPETE